MMSGRFTLPLGYSPEMECRILELPFTQKRISMFILLPDETDGLAALERKITAENVKMLFTTLEVIRAWLESYMEAAPHNRLHFRTTWSTCGYPGSGSRRRRASRRPCSASASPTSSTPPSPISTSWRQTRTSTSPQSRTSEFMIILVSFVHSGCLTC